VVNSSAQVHRLSRHVGWDGF